MKYLITGGAGFIGSHLIDELLKRGEQVRWLDNLSTGKREHVTRLQGKAEGIEGDLRNPADVRAAVEGVDVILHQAALPSVPRSIADPRTTHEVNVTGTLNLLWAAKEAGVKRVVFASSSSVYGNHPNLPKREEQTPQPLSPYAISKLAGEQYCQVFYKLYGLETICLRYFNVFGPRQDPSSQYSAVIPKFITAILRDESPTVHGDGTQSRDFTYIANVVEGNLRAATTTRGIGEVMNCACHDRITLNELIRQINEFLGKSVKPVHGAPRPGDIQHSFAAIERMREWLGDPPLVPFSEGLRRTIRSYLEAEPGTQPGR